MRILKSLQRSGIREPSKMSRVLLVIPNLAGIVDLAIEEGSLFEAYDEGAALSDNISHQLASNIGSANSILFKKCADPLDVTGGAISGHLGGDKTRQFGYGGGRSRSALFDSAAASKRIAWRGRGLVLFGPIGRGSRLAAPDGCLRR